MALSAGKRLGPYEIISSIGAGGMGEVYKAKDTRLDRSVAIKIMPSHLSNQAEARQRFEQEARAVSSLNHPNICTLHDIHLRQGYGGQVGEEEDIDYIVMEYIEGETLADRLQKGALPLEQALQYAVEIADALDKAHRQGVVHRDLKPGNIMLTKSGSKLLDFGLAKLQQSGPTGEPDLSALATEAKPLTQKGSILGTFQYMAPEQLEGKEVDARTDIFAFGAVVYEMVTGKKAFEGGSQASLISSIMTSRPPALSTLQSVSPPMLDHIVARCLAKDPSERWQTASDVMLELKWIGETGHAAEPMATLAEGQSRRPRLALAASVIGALLAGAVLWSFIQPAPAENRVVTKLSVNAPEGVQLRGNVALSRDGRTLIYVGIQDGVSRIYRRSMDQFESVAIAGTDGATSINFSPDGEWVVFHAGGELKKVALAGGSPVTLCDGGNGAMHWTPSGKIVFSNHTNGGGVFEIPSTGGVPRPLTELGEGEMGHIGPQLLPGEEVLLFTTRVSNEDGDQVVLQSLETGERLVVAKGSHARYASSGHVVFVRDNTLWAVPVAADRLEVVGEEAPLVEDVAVNSSGYGRYYVAHDGTIAYVSSTSTKQSVVRVDRDGSVASLDFEEGDYESLRFSPDGKRVAVTFGAETWDLWVYDLERGTRIRLTEGGSSHVMPAWTPDGKHLGIASTRTGSYDLYRVAADGGGEIEEVLVREAHQVPSSWSPDGKALLYNDTTGGSWSIWVMPIGGEPTPLVSTSFEERNHDLSPDGRWLAYESNESGRYEVYVQAYPGPGAKTAISKDGGRYPMWSGDGSELFYQNGDQMFVVAVEDRDDFRTGPPSLLFEVPHVENLGRVSDVSPDGQSFLMVREGESYAQEVHIVLNWLDEVERVAPRTK